MLTNLSWLLDSNLCTELCKVRCHLATEDVQLSMVSLGAQVLHHGDTSLLEYNAFVFINLILQAIHGQNATLSIQVGPALSYGTGYVVRRLPYQSV